MKIKLPSMKKKYIIPIIVVSILVIIAIVSLIIFLSNKDNGKIYEEKIKNYGIEKLYNNGTSNKSEYVTKSEALKLIIGTLLNVDNVDNYMLGNEVNDNYENAKWVEYAKLSNVISDDYITAQNENERISYIDIVKIASNAKNTLLLKNKNEDNSIIIENKDTLTQEEQAALVDLIKDGVIDSKFYAKNYNKDVKKQKFNEFICNLFEKYSGVIPEGENVINDNKDKPSNYNEYPYILESVEKETYEKSRFVFSDEDILSPIDSFYKIKNLYPVIKEKVESYYNVILNVNYENITKENFNSSKQNFSIPLNYSDSDYVDYVIQNEIKIEGNAKVQMPIIYYDGMRYRVRVKLEFEILNSKTGKDILYMDINNSKEDYQKQKYIMYVDVPLLVEENDIFVIEEPILDNLIG